jgi:hypothetical protein
MALAKQLGFEQRDGACYAELAKMIEKNKAREAAGWKSGAIFYKRHCDLKHETGVYGVLGVESGRVGEREQGLELEKQVLESPLSKQAM